MITSVAIRGFKCFKDSVEFPLSKVTLLYGRNGRGKSTLLQSLLLLSQTFKEKRNISNLILSSDRGFVDLGLFTDVVYKQEHAGTFGFDISSVTDKGELHKLHTLYSEFRGRPTLAKIDEISVDGNSLISEVVTDKGESSVTSEDMPASGTVAQTDIPALIELDSLRFVSANRLGPVNSQKRDDSREVDDLGNGGEFLLNVLGNQKDDFVNQIQRDLSRVLSGASIRTDASIDPEKIYLFLDSVDGDLKGYKPVNVGFGYSYILPILVTLRLASKGSIIIIENPEAHLHPGAQSELMKLLIEIAVEKRLQLILETHSDHIINGMRIAVKNGIITRKDANVLHFGRTEEGEPDIEDIKVDNNGQLSDYPDDFLDEMTKQLMQLM